MKIESELKGKILFPDWFSSVDFPVIQFPKFNIYVYDIWHRKFLGSRTNEKKKQLIVLINELDEELDCNCFQRIFVRNIYLGVCHVILLSRLCG